MGARSLGWFVQLRRACGASEVLGRVAAGVAVKGVREGVVTPF